MDETNQKVDLKEQFERARDTLGYWAYKVNETKGVPRREAKLDLIIAQNNMLAIRQMMLEERYLKLEKMMTDSQTPEPAGPVCIHCGKEIPREIMPDGIHCPDCGLVFGWTDADKEDPENVWTGYTTACEKKTYPINWPNWSGKDKARED